MRSLLTALLVLVVCLGACGRTQTGLREDAGSEGDDGSAPSRDATGENLPPVSNAGPDAEHLVGAPFALDGTASSDADGMVVAYAWSIDVRPAGSSAELHDALMPTASFTPDVVGTYTFRLLVTDDDGATDDDTVTVVVPWLSVDAGPDQTVVWRSTVQLGGSFVSDSAPVTLAWQFLSRPTSSGAVLQSASTVSPTFKADKIGTFVVEFAVTNPAGTLKDSVTVTVVPPPPEPIDGDIVDIDIGYAGRIVIASTNPSRIRLLDPVYSIYPTQEMSFALTVTPTAIGVSETGEFVTILHDSTRLTRARIPSLQQLSTINTHTALLDVRHGTANPHAYPAQAGPLMLVDFTADKVYPGGSVDAPSRGRQAPTATYGIYLIERGASPKLRRFNGGPQNTPFVRDWPYAAGQYELGSDLWFFGEQLVTSAGNVFRISDDPAVDMTHRTLLAGDQPFEIVGITGGAGTLVTLHTRITTGSEEPETQVRFYNSTTLALEHVVPLPDFVVGGVAKKTRGLAITSAPFDASHFFVVGIAGTSAGLFTIPAP